MRLRMLGATALAIGLAAGSSLGVAAQDNAADPMAPARFTATVGESDEMDTHAPLEATDARASGQLTLDFEEHVILGDTPDWVMLEVLAFRIDNDGGAWSGSGLGMFGDERLGFPPVSAATLLGDGDYEGLTMLLYPDGTDYGEPYWGIIVPTADIPEPPTLAPAE